MDGDSGGMASPGPQSQSSPMPPPQAPSPMGPPQQAPSPMPQQQGAPSPMGPPSHHPHSPNSYQPGPPPGVVGPPQHMNGPPNGGAMQQGTQTFQQHPPPPPPPHAQVPQVQIFLEGYGRKKTVSVKTALHDISTVYDLRIENLLIETLAWNFPTHQFLCEETKSSVTLTDDPTWIIDPIDGTINYTRRVPGAVICLALAVEKKIVLGVVCNPVTDETFSALKGQGAYLNEERIHVTDVKDVKNALIGYEFSMIGMRPDKSDDFVRQYRSCGSQALGMRSIGSCEMSLCMVAMGSLDGYYMDYVKPWDVAAGSIIVKEAGGCVFDTGGGEFDFEKGRILAASNETLGRQLVTIFSI